MTDRYAPPIRRLEHGKGHSYRDANDRTIERYGLPAGADT